MTTKAQSFNPWPLAIIATFIVFFAGTVTLVVMAANQRVDLVSADYYEQEIRYQERLDQVSRTSVVRSQVHISYDAAARAIRITLPADHAQRRVVGSVRLYRPSEAGLDRDAILELDPQGVQTVNAARLSHGLWKVRIQWKVDGQDYFVDESVIIPRLGLSGAVRGTGYTLLPLTPALSPGERENGPLSVGEIRDGVRQAKER